MSFETICCVGDSIANGYWCDRGLGWFGRLQEAVSAKYPKMYGFNNLAQSGDRSWDVYHRISGEVLTRRPDMLLIAIGINDLIRWNSLDGPLDQSPVSRGEAWQKILDVAVRNFPRTLVIGLLPSVESRYPSTGWDEKTPLWHKNVDTEEYDLEISARCAARGVPHLKLYDSFIKKDYAGLFEDGGHPNGRGHQLVMEHVLQKLESLSWIGA
jgi:lysophospholipase L1-like esterase